jgi:AcrR family transcriptional regulator
MKALNWAITIQNIVYVGYTMNDRRTNVGDGTGGVGRRDAHVQDTRRALLDAARELFAAGGFQATRTEEIVRRAGLTRGALYHHFRDKEDLFRAVYEEVSGEVGRLLLRRTGDRTPDAWALFRANSEIYLDAASSNPAYRQIVLIDGPAVFGWDHLSERSDGPTRKIMEYVAEAIEEGALDPQPVKPLAHLLSALGVGSALYVAQAEDPSTARREISECNERLLSGLDGRRSEAGRDSTPTDSTRTASTNSVAAGASSSSATPDAPRKDPRWLGISPPNLSSS